MFTALGILKLYEDKKLSLNDDLTTFFPSLPYKNITIRNLLNHTSGLPDYMYLFHKKWDRKLVANNNDVIKMLSKHHPKVYFKAGESFSYSNTGYVLLASIIEKVSQKPYNEYLKESFFQPFGMNSTRTIQNSRDFQEINIASDYLLDMEAQSFTDLQNLKDYDYLNYLQNIVGDGGIYTNLQDIEQLVKAFNNNLLISDSLYKMATSATQLPSGKTIKYGFGLMLSENGIVHHGGTWGGFQHYFAYDSNSSTLVYLLSNTNYPFVGSFAGKLISAVYRKNKPTFKNPYND
jgi:CubicO group peptidase (beta-lactamase class C family)